MHLLPSRLAFDLLTFLGNALWQVALIGILAGLLGRLLRGSSARHRHVFYTAALLASLLTPIAGVLLRRHDPSSPAKGHPNFALGTTFGIHDGAVLVGVAAGNALLLVALLFVAWRLLGLALAARRTLSLASSSCVPLNQEHAQLVSRAAATMGVEHFQAFASPAIAGPMTFGWRQPTIVIPTKLLEESSAELLSAAFGHELAHVRRKDFLRNMLLELLITPLAFHPGAWFLKRRVDETRELACDEIVASELIEPKAYARCLLRMAAFALGGPHHSYAMKAVAPPLLYERIQRLLAAAPRRQLALQGAFSLFLLMFTTIASTNLALPVVGVTPGDEWNWTRKVPSIDWAREGTAACVAGDTVGATEAREHLDETGRALLEVDCANVGLGYCSDRQAFVPFESEAP